MTAPLRALLLTCLVLSWTLASPFALAGDPPAAGAALTQSKVERVTVTGAVHMPDGRPAVGATVKSNSRSEAPATIARTDGAGRFQLQGVFGDGVRLHVSSADGNHQATLMVPALAVRTAVRSPLEVTLAPALTHQVIVLSAEHPVEGAQVAGSGTYFQVQGVTGQDGIVQLRHPAGEPLEHVSAWHPELGASGLRDLEDRLPKGETQLSLLPPGPHTIHVLDEDGKAIGGLELALNVRTEDSDWIIVQDIDAAHVRTDAQGTAVVPWFPRDKLKFVEVELMSSEWKNDETDRGQITAGITTVHARRGKDVEGRLIMSRGGQCRGYSGQRLWVWPGRPQRYSIRPCAARRFVHAPRFLRTRLSAWHH